MVRTLAANSFAASSFSSKMSHMALDLCSNTLATMLKAFSASSIIYMLTAIRFIYAVNRESVLVVTDSITDSTAISSFPEIYSLYSSLRRL